MRTRLLYAVAVVLLSAAAASAQSDLDAFMSRVIATRDENWKKLQQYVLEETETFQVIGPQNMRLYGGRREYQWFPRDGYFVRSPIRVDGVAIDEGTRRREEERHVLRERQREERRARRDAKEGKEPTPTTTASARADTDQPELNDILRQTVEPSFISSAYFLKFKFEEGHYALVGREKLLNRDVLRIEYYPARLFNDDNDRDRDDSDNRRERRQRRERDPKRQAEGEKIERQMNKASSVTLWVEPTAHQILQFELRNVDMDFLPGRSLARFDGLMATMKMGEPFPGIWLPDSMGFRFEMVTALGRGTAAYEVKYSDYRLASVSTRVR